MNSYGIQYLNKSLCTSIEKNSYLEHSNEEAYEIKKVLSEFQEGYTKRDLSKVENFVEELFIAREDICVLGTGTGELFLGTEQVKTLIKNDWEFWGDVSLDLENVHVDSKNEVAWFATTGNVKYSFQDTPERYDSYLNFIKDKTKEAELTPKQKITFINWVLALAYHQRFYEQREYLWPLRVSGVLLKDNGKWKFSHMQFSIPKANFPDERFENSKEFIESYNSQNAIADKHLNNQMDIEIKSILQDLETKLFGQKDVSKELINKYFAADNVPYIIEPDNQWRTGIEEIKEFFDSSSCSALALDLEHAIASRQSEVTWVTVSGILKVNLTEDKLLKRVLDDLDSLFEAEASSKDKLFAVHRSISYALKESALGEHYTCPIRLTAVLTNDMGKPVFQNIHFSFPFYWVFEGKLDSL
ncbi:nuclear transport factor 2 family protein [Clostridium swellfunianum]|uniref:nuclear transport factor 2 family protein n=1 Tax=Clostridium swellfunianum TaxID=1367462 RepID=UPI00202DC38F|nr:nuclear transport factor 2 family protein [Clostridium swellfunianum]MCM0650263.1 nuclear transport factor 2 family protein [Clostridium swellfunianum]